MRHMILFLVALVCACSELPLQDQQRSEEWLADVEDDVGQREDEEKVEGRALLDVEDTPPDPAGERGEADPYEGWDRWCEPAEMHTCRTADDCGAFEHPSERPLKCVKPWYADRDSDLRVCAPGWPSRYERDHERARLRELVRLQYTSRKDRGERLAKFVTLVSHRETTLRGWKRHRLNEDVAANRDSYVLQAERYGHDTKFATVKVKRAGKLVRKSVPVGVAFKADGNRHYRDQSRWRYGLGLYGMNAAIHTRSWDPKAPPEVLCKEVEATEVYLRTARRAWRKLSSGIDCDGDGIREWHGHGGSPTLHDVHMAASSGKLCPGRHKDTFDERARRYDLDPYAPISLADLGEPIPKDVQNERAAELLGELDRFSVAWRRTEARG